MTAHIHAKEMLLYAQDSNKSKKAWLKWQQMVPGAKAWVDLSSHPEWDEAAKYQRKPDSIKINGVELPDTRISQTSLLVGEKYFVESPAERDFFEEVTYDGSLWDDRVISREIAHSTADGAAATCRARFNLKVNA